MQPLDPNLSTFQKARYLWQTYIREHKRILIAAFFVGWASAGLAGFGIPFIMRDVFPIVFGTEQLPESIRQWLQEHFPADRIQSITLWGTAAFLPLVVLLKGVTSFSNAYLLTKMGLRILEKMRLQVFSRYQQLPLAFHEKRKRGDLLSRLIHDTQFLQEGMMNIAADLIIQPLTLLAAMGYLVYASVKNDQLPFLLVNMAVAITCVPIIKKLGTRMLKRARAMLSGLGDITATIQENLSAQRDIRAFGMEQQQKTQLKGQIRTFFQAMMRITIWQQSITPAIEIVSAVALAFSLYIGSQSGLGIYEFTGLCTAIYYCYDPIKKLGNVSNQLRMTGVMMSRINEIIYADDKMPEPEHPVAIGRAKGVIDYKNVDFAYEEGNPVLHNVNIHVPEGQIVALVGPSGSGKTTFINLLCRFYDVNDGAILIDGVDVRSLSKKELHENIGLVSQHSVLFRASILENIRLGRRDASDEEVSKAGQLAYVDDFTDHSPEGYAQMVGEGGEGLSGGQRQRVSIARAFLKNAPILILDEATASLDMTSEAKIQESLDNLTHGRTTFVIAHRFSTIRMAHRILVFEKGHIVGDGTHEELYAHSPIYRDLYDKQIMN